MNQNEQTIRTFDKSAEAYQQKYLDWEFYEATYARICELIDDDDARILDVACGPGIIARYLLNKRPGFNVLGIDAAPNMIKIAKQNVPTAEFRVMDGRQINALKDSFDAIVGGFYLPYISMADAETLFREAKRMLKPRGLLYLSAIAGGYAQSAVQSSSDGDQIHVYLYSPGMISERLRANDFEVIQTIRKRLPNVDEKFADEFFVYARRN